MNLLPNIVAWDHQMGTGHMFQQRIQTPAERDSVPAVNISCFGFYAQDLALFSLNRKKKSLKVMKAKKY